MKPYRKSGMAITIIFVIAVFSLIAGIWAGMSTYGWVNDAKSSEGTVVEVIESRTNKKKRTFKPKVAYEVDGLKREFVSSLGSNPPSYEVGDKVRVVSNISRDKEDIISLGALYGFPITLILMGSVATLVALLFRNGEMVLRLIHPGLFR